MKNTIRFTEKTKSTADPKQQGEISKSIADQKKALKSLIKQQKETKKSISNMKKQKTNTKKEGFINSSAKSLLNQYENTD